jgi:hypothetical protein
MVSAVLQYRPAVQHHLTLEQDMLTSCYCRRPGGLQSLILPYSVIRRISLSPNVILPTAQSIQSSHDMAKDCQVCGPVEKLSIAKHGSRTSAVATSDILPSAAPFSMRSETHPSSVVSWPCEVSSHPRRALYAVAKHE